MYDTESNDAELMETESNDEEFIDWSLVGICNYDLYKNHEDCPTSVHFRCQVEDENFMVEMPMHEHIIYGSNDLDACELGIRASKYLWFQVTSIGDEKFKLYWQIMHDNPIKIIFEHKKGTLFCFESKENLIKQEYPTANIVNLKDGRIKVDFNLGEAL